MVMSPPNMIDEVRTRALSAFREERAYHHSTMVGHHLLV